MVLTLYKKDTSPPCRTVYMVLEALKITDVEYVNINPQQKENLTTEYLKMNPQHTIPTLKDDDFVVWDSHAITTYLCNKYGNDDFLYPKDPRRRALVDQKLHFDSGILFPALINAVVPIIYQGQKKYSEEHLAKITAAYDLIEKFFYGPWLTGYSVTLADIACVSTISTLNEIVPIDAKVYPNLTAWFARSATQEYYIKGNLTGLQAFRDMIAGKLAQNNS